MAAVNIVLIIDLCYARWLSKGRLIGKVWPTYCQFSTLSAFCICWFQRVGLCALGKLERIAIEQLHKTLIESLLLCGCQNDFLPAIVLFSIMGLRAVNFVVFELPSELSNEQRFERVKLHCVV